MASHHPNALQVDQYMATHAIAPLFRDLMARLIEHQPHEPVPFLIALLRKRLGLAPELAATLLPLRRHILTDKELADLEEKENFDLPAESCETRVEQTKQLGGPPAERARLTPLRAERLLAATSAAPEAARPERVVLDNDEIESLPVTLAPALPGTIRQPPPPVPEIDAAVCNNCKRPLDAQPDAQPLELTDNAPPTRHDPHSDNVDHSAPPAIAVPEFDAVEDFLLADTPATWPNAGAARSDAANANAAAADDDDEDEEICGSPIAKFRRASSVWSAPSAGDSDAAYEAVLAGARFLDNLRMPDIDEGAFVSSTRMLGPDHDPKLVLDATSDGNVEENYGVAHGALSDSLSLAPPIAGVEFEAAVFSSGADEGDDDSFS